MTQFPSTVLAKPVLSPGAKGQEERGQVGRGQEHGGQTDKGQVPAWPSGPRAPGSPRHPRPVPQPPGRGSVPEAAPAEVGRGTRGQARGIRPRAPGRGRPTLPGSPARSPAQQTPAAQATGLCLPPGQRRGRGASRKRGGDDCAETGRRGVRETRSARGARQPRGHVPPSFQAAGTRQAAPTSSSSRDCENSLGPCLEHAGPPPVPREPIGMGLRQKARKRPIRAPRGGASS